MTALQLSPVAASGPIRRPRSLLSLTRPLFDRILPALVFGLLAAGRCVGLLLRAQRGPADSGSQAGLIYLLDLAHYALAFLFLALLATLFLIRRSPLGARAGVLPMAVALLGTFVINTAFVQPRTTEDWRVLALADLLLVAGLAFTIYALAFLRHCFGLAAEARGLVTAGPYRLVRHPVYLGEFVAFLGALLPVLSPLTTAIFAVFCLLQAWRASLEERVLAATFAAYADYRRRTPAVLPWPRP